LALATTVITAASLGALPSEPEQHSQPSESDLATIVRNARAAAARIGHRPGHRPWLAPLPDVVAVDQLAAPGEGWHLPYAVVDRPQQQIQHTLSWDLAADTHLMVVGSLRTGRTSTLRTLAGAIGGRFETAGVHIHVIDGGSGGLGAVRHLPHAGVV